MVTGEEDSAFVFEQIFVVGTSWRSWSHTLIRPERGRCCNLRST